jgi:hypothetical protein
MKRLGREIRVSAKTLEKSNELTLLQTKDGKFVVSSESEPNGGYYVDLIRGCECKGYYFYEYCKHYHCLKMYLAKTDNS